MSLFQKCKSRGIISQEEYLTGGGAEQLMRSLNEFNISTEGLIGGIAKMISWVFEKIGAAFKWIIDRFKKSSEKPSSKVVRSWSSMTVEDRKKYIKLALSSIDNVTVNYKKETDTITPEDKERAIKALQSISVFVLSPKVFTDPNKTPEIKSREIVNNIKQYIADQNVIMKGTLELLKNHHDAIIRLRKKLVNAAEIKDESVINQHRDVAEQFSAEAKVLNEQIKDLNRYCTAANLCEQQEKTDDNDGIFYRIASPSHGVELDSVYYDPEKGRMLKLKESDLTQYYKELTFSLSLSCSGNITDNVEFTWDDVIDVQDFINSNPDQLAEIIEATIALNKATEKEATSFPMDVERISKEYLGETGKREFDALGDTDSNKKEREWIASLARDLIHSTKNIAAISLFISNHVFYTENILNQFTKHFKIVKDTSTESYSFEPSSMSLSNCKLGGVYLKR